MVLDLHMKKNDVINKRYCSFIVLTFMIFLFSTFSVSASVNRACLSQATTEYERIYCEIISRGEGKALPRFEDFKLNDALVQKLLLKRPASKLKIKLPSHALTNPTKNKPTKNKPTKNKKAKHTQALNKQELDKKTTSDALGQYSIKQCQLTHDKILCGKQRFVMRTNQPNKQLSSGVLNDSYKMGLPVYAGSKGDALEVQYYLSNAYALYIRRMIDIGLGASTMSYTRFFHTYYDLQEKNVSFSERFETMYSYLKKDKKSMAVQTVLSDKRPVHISECDDINAKIIACDSGGFNWIYVN